MDITLKSFRSYEFDGYIYAQCTGLTYLNTSVTYSIYSDEKLIQHQTAPTSKQVCFEELLPANYTVRATYKAADKSTKTLPEIKIKIPQSPSKANFLQDLINLETSQELFLKHPELEADVKKLFEPPTVIATSSLKPRQPVEKGIDAVLDIMFELGGFEKLALLSSEKREYDSKLNGKLILVPVFDRKKLLAKQGKAVALTALINLYRLETPLNNDELFLLAEELEKLDYVKYCSLAQDVKHLAPPPLIEEERISLVAQNETPDFTELQTYLNEGKGMNILNAWKKDANGRTATVRHLDFGVYRNHEDLFGNLTVVSTRPETQDCNHGTASTGCIVAKNNPYGVTGIANRCAFYFYDTGDTSRVVEDMGVGDILSFDIQVESNTLLFPHLYVRAIWDQYRYAVDAGAVVIFAGGNGNNDLLNTPTFSNHGDSGAIMIGACNSTSGRRSSFSNYNLYLSMNSWGDSVTTTGYGSLQDGEGTNRDYTSSYSGTSSATPLASGALAVIQSYAIQRNVYFNSVQMAALIKVYGYDEAEGQFIGSRPNADGVLQAIAQLIQGT